MRTCFHNKHDARPLPFPFPLQKTLPGCPLPREPFNQASHTFVSRIVSTHVSTRQSGIDLRRCLLPSIITLPSLLPLGRVGNGLTVPCTRLFFACLYMYQSKRAAAHTETISRVSRTSQEGSPPPRLSPIPRIQLAKASNV